MIGRSSLLGYLLYNWRYGSACFVCRVVFLLYNANLSWLVFPVLFNQYYLWLLSMSIFTALFTFAIYLRMYYVLSSSKFPWEVQWHLSLLCMVFPHHKLVDNYALKFYSLAYMLYRPFSWQIESLNCLLQLLDFCFIVYHLASLVLDSIISAGCLNIILGVVTSTVTLNICLDWDFRLQKTCGKDGKPVTTPLFTKFRSMLCILNFFLQILFMIYRVG